MVLIIKDNLLNNYLTTGTTLDFQAQNEYAIATQQLAPESIMITGAVRTGVVESRLEFGGCFLNLLSHIIVHAASRIKAEIMVMMPTNCGAIR